MSEGYKSISPLLLQALYPDRMHLHGYATVWTKTDRGGSTVWIPLDRSGWIEDAIGLIERLKLSPGNEIYISAGSYSATLPPAGEAGKRRIGGNYPPVGLTSLYCDIDTQEDPFKAGKDVPKNISEAIEYLTGLRHKPSIVVCSGQGVHAYWLLTEPVNLQEVDAHNDILMPFFYGVMDGRWKDLDYKAATDACRVLRMNDTLNLKRCRDNKGKYQPDQADKALRTCIVYPEEPVAEDALTRYTLDELSGEISAGREAMQHAADHKATTQTERNRSISVSTESVSSATSGKTNYQYFADGLVNDPSLCDKWNPHPGDSEEDMSVIAKIAYWTNWDRELTISLFKQSPYWANGREDEKREKKGGRSLADYVSGTYDKLCRKENSFDCARKHDEEWQPHDYWSEKGNRNIVAHKTALTPNRGENDALNQLIGRVTDNGDVVTLKDQVEAVNNFNGIFIRSTAGEITFTQLPVKGLKYTDDLGLFVSRPLPAWLMWDDTSKSFVQDYDALCELLIDRFSLNRDRSFYFSDKIQIVEQDMRTWIRTSFKAYGLRIDDRKLKEILSGLKDNIPLQTRAKLVPTRLFDVEEKPLEFIFRPWFKLGDITLICGDPGAGKGMFMCGVMAAMYHNIGLCGVRCETQRRAVIFSTEDTEATWKRRIKHSFPGQDKNVLRENIDIFGKDHPDAYDISIDDGRLDEYFTERAPCMAIFDPLQNYLPKDAVGRDLDMNSMSAMGPALQKLTQLLERHKCCGIIFCHTSKRDCRSFADKVSGSKGIVGAARSAVMIVPDPESNEEGARIAIHFKHNETSKGPAIRYQIKPVEEDQDAARCCFTRLVHGYTEQSYFKALRSSQQMGNDENAPTEPLKEFILKLLEDNQSRTRLFVRYQDIIAGVQAMRGGDAIYTTPQQVHQAANALTVEMKMTHSIQITIPDGSKRAEPCVFNGMPFPEGGTKTGKGIEIQRISKPGQQSIIS